MTLLLVRHAEPMTPGIAGYEENERPLSEAGREQSLRLAERLADAGITAIYSSPYPRARQTVEPLAERLRLPVAVVPDLRERLLATGPLPDWLDHVEPLVGRLLLRARGRGVVRGGTGPCVAGARAAGRAAPF